MLSARQSPAALCLTRFSLKATLEKAAVRLKEETEPVQIHILVLPLPEVALAFTLPTFLGAGPPHSTCAYVK